MHKRYDPRRDEEDERRRDPPRARSSADDVLALQQAIGNRGTARLLARDKDKDKDKDRPGFEHSVTFGKSGPIEITGGNVADWAAKKDPEGLHVISVSGKHSDELKRLFDSKGRIDTLETASVVGENSLVTITFTNCRIKRFSTDGKKDDWTVEFDTAKRQTLAIGAPRR